MPRLTKTYLVSVLATSTFAANVNGESVSDLAWLAGCWASKGAELGSGEQWTVPAGGTLLGMSRTVKDGKTVAYEFMRILEIAPGRLAFIAHPSGQAEASFELFQLNDSEVVFENREHDFPQRIIYRLERNEVLQARIEGQRNGELRSIDFPMQRVDCDSWQPIPPRRS